MKKLWSKQNWAAKLEEVAIFFLIFSETNLFFIFYFQRQIFFNIYIYIYIYIKKDKKNEQGPTVGTMAFSLCAKFLDFGFSCRK